MSGNRNKRLYSRGRWAVERERCRIDVGVAAPMAPTEECAVRDVLPGLLDRLGLGDMHWLDRFVADWAETMGPAVASHTRPGRYRDGFLTVFVDSSVWLNELMRFGKAPMLAKLRARHGESSVKDLRLQLDPD